MAVPRLTEDFQGQAIPDCRWPNLSGLTADLSLAGYRITHPQLYVYSNQLKATSIHVTAPGTAVRFELCRFFK